MMTPRQRLLLEELTEDLPMDVLPVSNGEYFPGRPTREQRAIMALQDEKIEETRRRFGMSRRDFVRTAAAMSIGAWSIGAITNGRFGRYAFAAEEDSRKQAMCNLEWEGAQLDNLPGEFIFDLQTHHVDSGGDWRLRNPRSQLIYAALWPQAGPLGGVPGLNDDSSPHGFGRGGEIDPMENLGRYHYIKEIFLDSSTSMTCLSAVPNDPDNQPLPVDEAARTCNMINALANNTPRAMLHAFVMPNRGSLGTASAGVHRPVFMTEEFEMMERHVLAHPALKGWKVYTPWGDVSGASGWFLDDAIGLAFLDQVRHLGDKYGIPKTIAVHKGFWLPGFDQSKAAARDVGPAATQYPDVNFVIYHSGFDGWDRETDGWYPGDDGWDEADRSTNSLIKSLRLHGLDGPSNIPAGLAHGNAPNVWAEIGSLWRSVMTNADRASLMLGKLIHHVGAQRVCWGTDTLWYGSPQPEITMLRALQMTDEVKERYNLPYGLDGDRFDPRRNALDANSYRSAHPAVADWPTDGRAHPERTIRNGIFGRNVAPQYDVDPDAARAKIDCDEVQSLRDQYWLNPYTPRMEAPYRFNELGPLRTDADVWHELRSTPWSP
jgi:uncharacterized protein